MALPAIFSGLSSVGGLLNVFGANAAAERARREREQAMLQLANAYAAIENARSNANGQQLLSLQGLSGDHLRNLGGDLGASLAAAGVYNPSSVSGALLGAQQNNATALANLAMQNQNALSDLQGQHAAQLAQMRLGYNAGDMQRAYSLQDAAAGGLGSILGGVAQYFAPQPQALAATAPTQWGPYLQSQGVTDADLYTTRAAPLSLSVQPVAAAPVLPQGAILSDRTAKPGMPSYYQQAQSLLGHNTQNMLGGMGTNLMATYQPLMNGTLGQQALRKPGAAYASPYAVLGR